MIMSGSQEVLLDMLFSISNMCPNCNNALFLVESFYAVFSMLVAIIGQEISYVR